MDRSGRWTPPASVGVRDGPGHVEVDVRAAGADHGPACLDRVPCRGLRLLRRGAAPVGAGQPAHRGRPPGPVRPEDQPLVCRTRRTLRDSGRPRPPRQAEGQAAGGATDAVCAGLVLARPGVDLAAADATSRAVLVPRGRRTTLLPSPGRRLPGLGVHRSGSRSAACLAAQTVRAGHLVGRHGRPGHPRQGRQDPLLGALAAHRPAGRRSHHTVDGADLRRW